MQSGPRRICVWIYLWAFYFVPLIYISVFVPVPYCLDNCGFVAEPWNQVGWFLQFHSSFSRSLWLFEVFCIFFSLTSHFCLFFSDLLFISFVFFFLLSCFVFYKLSRILLIFVILTNSLLSSLQRSYFDSNLGVLMLWYLLIYKILNFYGAKHISCISVLIKKFFPTLD